MVAFRPKIVEVTTKRPKPVIRARAIIAANISEALPTVIEVEICGTRREDSNVAFGDEGLFGESINDIKGPSDFSPSQNGRQMNPAMLTF